MTQNVLRGGGRGYRCAVRRVAERCERWAGALPLACFLAGLWAIVLLLVLEVS